LLGFAASNRSQNASRLTPAEGEIRKADTERIVPGLPSPLAST
jgi:hypothetical protein